MWVTSDQIDEARQVDLLNYLRRFEPDNLMHLGGDSYCTREHDSLKISNGKWHWFSRHIGGKNALDYLVKVRGVSFTDAVCTLTGYAAQPPPATQKPKSKERTLELPEPNENNYRVRRYLQSRGISDAVIEYCMDKGLLFEDAQYHNCMFLGFDGDTPKYGAVRSTTSDFKRELTGSDKRFSFSIPAENETDTVHVFEAAIDLLSYATMERGSFRKDELLSLASVYGTDNAKDIPIALKACLENKPYLKTVCLHLDNDEVGRMAAQHITEALSGSYTVLDQPPKSGKDYNDYLINSIRRRDAER